MSADPTTWGAQPTGWVTPTAADILERLETDERSTMGAQIDVDADAQIGQINGIVAAQLGLAWEALGALEAARSRDGAEGAMLDDTGKLTGTSRNGASPTKVPCTVILNAGTTLTVDYLASIAGHPEITFRPVENFTASTTGLYTRVFECTETGPIQVSPGTLTIITTPVSGWVSITNPTAGVTGSDIAEDSDYRLEQERDLAASGSATTLAIASDLVYDPADETGVFGVLSAQVLENDTDVTNSDGLPPHSIECVLYTDGTEDEAKLIAAIWNAKPAGCATWGTESGTYIDPNGEQHEVRYSVVVHKPVYLNYSLIAGTDYAGDIAVKAAIVLAANERAVIGADAMAVWLKALPMQSTGVIDVTGMQLGFAPGPTGTTNLEIGIRERAVFSADRIVIA